MTAKPLAPRLPGSRSPSPDTPPLTSTLSGWGRAPVVPGVEIRDEDLRALTKDIPLVRGLGRAYGDAALPAPGDVAIAGSTRADRILSFDPTTGILRAEAGLSLDTICDLFLPRGFFTPITPGTRFVTLGGMVACDVHGKNHHVDGTLGRHVGALTIRTGTGHIVTCSPDQHADLFWATIGGMGLTGAVLDVTVRLTPIPSPWIFEERECMPDIDTFVTALKGAQATWPMTAGWIDCLSGGRSMGRGVILRGRWATADEAPGPFPGGYRRPSVPVDFPEFALSRPTIRLFNDVFYLKHRRGSRRVVHPYTFFYPLDAIGRWTRMYGTRGFTQYQCVLPEAAGPDAPRRFLTALTSRGGASFLCVIKDCGAEGQGLLSFPRPGISIALDIPMRDHTQALIDALNEQVLREGGRIYLAKDALSRAEHYRAMDPRVGHFLDVRRHWDPDGRVRSAQSARLFGW
ncbi:MAG TPA: FAD-binding oxidoreductase [Vicinamibacterales bacterium]|nr:FAD-binding oxidoreductase [Vicinamibacterales bacterium]